MNGRYSGSGIETLAKEVGLWLFGCALVFAGVFFADDIAQFVKPVINSAVQSANRTLAGGNGTRRQAPTRTATTSSNGSQRVYIRADRYNQFFTEARINGSALRVLVDTGASHVSLRYEDAEEVGIFLSDADFTHTSRTANGTTRVAPVMIDKIQIGGIVVRDIPGSVGEPGKKFVTLLGMAFLGRLKRVSFSGRRLELEQ